MSAIKNSWQWVHVSDSLLTPDWHERLVTFRRLFVAFSGGLDSTALLHNLIQFPELRHRITAVHINHGLSANADAWQAHCQDFAYTFSISCKAVALSLDMSSNIEEQARMARYDAFADMMTEHDCLLLGHHGDDQAETLLLQLLRGAGVDGLSAMSSLQSFRQGMMARPFLNHKREVIYQYALGERLSWVEDESNASLAYSRNFLRHHIFPLLQNKWPGFANCLRQSASHCREASQNLFDLALLDCPQLANQNNSLDLCVITKLPMHRLSNVIRTWLKVNQIQLPTTSTFKRIFTEVIAARQDAVPFVEWNTVQIRRYQQRLYLVDKVNLCLSRQALSWTDFPSPLLLNAQEALTAVAVEKGLMLPTGAKIDIRYRQGGEKLVWHRQTKSLKKLLQIWQIPPWLRDSIPLLYVNGELAAVIGYALSDHFWGEGRAYKIVTSPTQL